jgi:hypothetical protein
MQKERSNPKDIAAAAPKPVAESAAYIKNAPYRAHQVAIPIVQQPAQRYLIASRVIYHYHLCPTATYFSIIPQTLPSYALNTLIHTETLDSCTLSLFRCQLFTMAPHITYSFESLLCLHKVQSIVSNMNLYPILLTSTPVKVPCKYQKYSSFTL